MPTDPKKTRTSISLDALAGTIWETGGVWMGFDDTTDLPTGNQWQPKRCTCGCWITYGEKCPIEFHSQWCDLIRKD